jgi:hypothetical protein
MRAETNLQIIYRNPVPTSQRTKITALMMFREILPVCHEAHTQQIQRVGKLQSFLEFTEGHAGSYHWPFSQRMNLEIGKILM